MVTHLKCDNQGPFYISLLFQIDPKVAFPRRAQPKVGVSVSERTSVTEGSDIPSIPFYERCFWNLCGLGWEEGEFLISSLCGLKIPCIIFPSALGWTGEGLHVLGEGEPLRGPIVLYLKPVWFGP